MGKNKNNRNQNQFIMDDESNNNVNDPDINTQPFETIPNKKKNIFKQLQNTDSENNSETSSETDEETIIDIEDNEEEEDEKIQLIIDRQSQIGVSLGNPPFDLRDISGLHRDINQHITDAIHLITANVTIRNNEILDFNNNWNIDHLYNNVTDSQLHHNNNSALEVIIPNELSFNEDNEESELREKENLQNKNIV